MRALTTVLVVVCIGVILSAISPPTEAATFENMDFEQAFYGEYPPPDGDFQFSVPVSTALPYWTVKGEYWTTNQYVGYNVFYLDVPDVELVSPSYYCPVPQGNYAVLLENINNENGREVSISQTGTIPSSVAGQSTKSVRLTCSSLWGGQSIDGVYLSLNGNDIPLAVTSMDGDFCELGGNIPNALRGRTTELKIGFAATTNGYGDGVVIDSIHFSNVTVIPEPSSLILLAIGAIGLLAWRKR
jgi:hypothetical protein